MTKKVTDRNVCSTLKSSDEEILRFAQNDEKGKGEYLYFSDRRNSFFYNTYQNKNWSGSPINTFGDDSCVYFGDDKERTDRNVCSKLKKLDEEILRFAQNDGGVMRRFLANARDNKKRRGCIFAATKDLSLLFLVFIVDSIDIYLCGVQYEVS